MDKTLQLEALIKSHREIQKLNLIEWASMEGISHSGADPFDERNLPGDFIYSSNKITKRYSPLYRALDDEGLIFQHCKMDMGYTTLLVCEKLGTTKGKNPIAFKEYYQVRGEEGLENKYCVFQNPYMKLSQHGPHDILKICSTLEQANDFALDFTASEEISTLIAKVKFHINWH